MGQSNGMFPQISARKNNLLDGNQLENTSMYSHNTQNRSMPKSYGKGRSINIRKAGQDDVESLKSSEHGLNNLE